MDICFFPFLVTGLAIKAFSQSTLRVSESTLRKAAIKTVMPSFPEESRKHKKTGIAVAFLHIDEKGNVGKVDTLDAPDPLIKEAVVSAIKQWVFKPTHFRGEPVKVQGKLTFYYIIDGKGARVEIKSLKLWVRVHGLQRLHFSDLIV